LNIKIFLNYLVHQKYLTPSQIKTTLPQTTEAKVLLNALVKQGYFSSEELKNHLKNFKEQQSPPSFRVSQEMKASLEEELLQEKQDPFSPLPSTQFLSKTAEELHCAPPVTATPVEQDFLETFQDLPPTQVSALQTLTLLDSMELIPQQEKLPTARHSTVFTSKKKIERYEVLETLGEGGMGVVQRVKDHLLGREVALKRIKFDEKGFNALSKRQQAMLWRLNREAYITSTLEHPHIVPLHEIQKEENGELYFTMRKVEGKTFATLLQETSQQQNYSEEERLSVFLKVCDAVAYSHSKSIVHRDLKPENIMVGKFGEVYVMDWGIAKILEESDPTLEDLEEIQKQLQPEEAEKYLTIGEWNSGLYGS
jgi:tRNA A-37 threonylcarbamoyl transferase component Bud32